jgi:hypothetical protein
MAQAAKNTQMSRQAGKQAAKGKENPIAALPGKTDTATVRTARAAGLKTGNNFTGQYLYDRWVKPSAAETREDNTKLGIVQQMVGALDPFQFKTIVAEMVNIAKTLMDNTIKAEKDAKVYNEEDESLNVREQRANLKTARNHQTVMRNAYGALKFCADELKAKAGDREIGYRLIREIGSDLLKSKGINWDGTKAEAPQERQARSAQANETRAMLEVQKEVPRKENESRASYFARIDAEVTKRLAAVEAENREKEITALTVKIRQLAGAHLPDIIELLIQAQENPGAAGPAPAEVTTGTVASMPDVNLH